MCPWVGLVPRQTRSERRKRSRRREFAKDVAYEEREALLTPALALDLPFLFNVGNTTLQDSI